MLNRPCLSRYSAAPRIQLIAFRRAVKSAGDLLI